MLDADKNAVMPTGIAALDKLISGDPEPQVPKQLGIPVGSSVLIRGEPGAGKTTLAMQILDAYLKANTRATDRAVFISVEEAPMAVLERMKKQFNFFADSESQPPAVERRIEASTKNKEDWLQEKQVIDRLLKTTTRCGPSERISAVGPSELMKALDVTISKRGESSSGGSVVGEMGDAISGMAGRWAGPLRIFLKALRHWAKAKLTAKQKPIPQGVVVIDSLNAWLTLAESYLPSAPPRVLLSMFCQEMREAFAEDASRTSEITLIFTGEHHYFDRNESTGGSESFFCDVEIILRPEPIWISGGMEYKIQTPMGYTLTSTIPEGSRSIESRSFCRVMKSRRSSNQSRRCAYDITTGLGLEFFETYPGDGKIVLFAENQAQENAWESFFSDDIPDSYPSLRSEVFDRMNMQTVYEGQRRLRNVPLRTDMWLASFDSYWVSWYRDFKLKCDIDRTLRRRLGPPKNQEGYASLVNVVMHVFDEVPPMISRYKRGIADLKNRMILATKRKRTKAAWKTIAEKYKAIWDKATVPYENGNQLASKVIRTLFDDDQFTGTFSSFLRPIPWKDLKLFGEARSEVIHELVKSRVPLRGVEWSKELLKGNDKTRRANWFKSHWLSIPYDANISFMVYRQDVLRGCAGHFEQSVVVDTLKSIVSREKEILAHDNTPSELNEYELFILDCAARRVAHGEPPETWEEIIAYCKMLGKHAILETQTFNSFICTALEMIWNCGCPDFMVSATYQPHGRNYRTAILRTFHLLNELFSSGVTPQNSTVSMGNDRGMPEPDWLFCRHWYSTLNDMLTAKDDQGVYRWRDHEPATIGITHLPTCITAWGEHVKAEISRWRKDEKIKKIKVNDQGLWKHVSHCNQAFRCFCIEDFCSHRNCLDQTRRLQKDRHSCWGDWGLGVLEGSENLTLAIDLINNIMASMKVCERAFKGACIPTVETFYELYGNTPCLRADWRPEISLPSMSFNDLRSKYFKHARTRHSIHDLRRFAKALHAKVESVRLQTSRISAETIAGFEKDLFKDLKELCSQPILLE
jgi:hypothetical protein